jgi:hypothetical protein
LDRTRGRDQLLVVEVATRDEVHEVLRGVVGPCEPGESSVPRKLAGRQPAHNSGVGVAQSVEPALDADRRHRHRRLVFEVVAPRVEGGGVVDGCFDGRGRVTDEPALRERHRHVSTIHRSCCPGVVGTGARDQRRDDQQHGEREGPTHAGDGTPMAPPLRVAA